MTRDTLRNSFLTSQDEGKQVDTMEKKFSLETKDKNGNMPESRKETNTIHQKNNKVLKPAFMERNFILETRDKDSVKTKSIEVLKYIQQEENTGD